MEPEKRAVVLLSGGIDSAVASAIARKAGYKLFGLSFDYGQKHIKELKSAQKIAKYLGFAHHLICKIPLAQIAQSALLGNSEIPKARTEQEIQTEIPSTYVPARNLIFLSLAVAYAETIKAEAIVIGAHTIDYSGYPDCRPEFLDAFQRTANLATKAGTEHRLIRIWPPVIHLNKTEIIQTGIELGLDFSLTFSCYDPDEEGRACGVCDSCLFRKKAFQALGKKDPIRYR